MVHALVPMWRESFEHGLGIVDWHPIAKQRTHLLERVVLEYRVLVALEGEHVVGFVVSNAESVNHLYVRVAIAFGFEPTWQLDDGKYAWRAEAPLTPLDTSRLRA